MSDQRQTILIVDDDSEFRSSTAGLIRSLIPRVQVVESGDASEAFFKIDKQLFDLLITDVKMPKMDGVNLIKKLSALSPSQRPGSILVMSGEVDNQEVKTELGDVPYLSKPFQKDQLVSLLNQLLGREKRAASPVVKVDAEFIEPFVTAALEVLKLTAQTQATKEKSFIRDGNQMSGDISALVAMNSEAYLGSMAISFEKTTFLGVLEGMLGEKYPDINPENQDACAEICNQIFGMAKKVLNQRGHTIQPAIPSVVVGEKHTLKHSAKGPCIAVRFKTPHGAFTVEAVVEARVSK